VRLHTLELTAFGPFPATEVVDLDEVGRDGLFLLWGPTGAGKTTLLDAVVFALYGTVPGVRGHEKRLRSDHADAATRTQVTCELTLAGERLRVERRPEQTRPKKRGSGETTEPAKLLVQRWTGEGWAPVSTRIDEGSEYLATRLGLTAEQFCQVVLLPQGDFARFLRAEPEDRARLLGTLFDVTRFVRAEEWLTGERRAAEEALRRERVRTSTLLARVAQIADAEVPEELAPELVGAVPRGPVDAWVGGLRVRAAGELAAAEGAAAEAAEDAARLDAELTAARALADRHARRERARAELARLTAEEADLAPLRAELDAARRAEPVRDVLEAAGRAALDAERAGAALDAARAAWAPVAAGREPGEVLARELRDAVAAVRALLPEAERARSLSRRTAALDGEVAGLAERCAAAQDAATAWPGRLAAQQEYVDRAQEAAAALPGVRAAAEAAAARLAAARSAARLEQRLPAARATAAAAREAWLAAREHLVDLRTRRLDGMAAELAAGLAAGDACPVCGATEHPAPAAATGAAVSAEDEERARAEVDAAEERAAAARGALDEQERELAVLRERAGPLGAGDLAREAAEAEAERAAVAGRAAELPRLREELARLSAERERAAALLAADREQLQACTAEREITRARLAELTATLDAARGDDPDLPARIRRLEEAAARCEAVLAAAAEEVRARAAADTDREAAAKRAAEEGFADVLAAAAALLEPGEVGRLERRIEEHDRAAAAVAAVLAEPELADLGPLPDLALQQQRCAAGTIRREEAVAALDRARRRAAALDELAGDVVAAEVELDARRAEAQEVGALADLVAGRGANALRMRLPSFVLAARLEQVADVASRRLREMSGGRYTFEHSDAQGRHGARGGLGLVVLDEYTGQRRSTKTLSGGESFMASLALALALADVVTAESGGVQIDTLFVDEGFGTLDAQALDAVMGVLDDLRRGGRTVGVISHVEELRTRIPTRLEVIAGRHGSRLAG
jgi:DNA repair protein SbcC/Rad50